MAEDDGNLPRRGQMGAVQAAIEEDLSLLSIEELHERLTHLKFEAERTERQIKAKEGSRADADAVFKL